VDLIESYCRKDVELTAKIFFLGRVRGYLLYKDSLGRLMRFPVDW
jgi:DEAD/DEAH box helicase domain-containing protein